MLKYYTLHNILSLLWVSKKLVEKVSSFDANFIVFLLLMFIIDI